MNITIEKIVYPGKSLARLEGKVVFTDEGLPLETVEITLIKETTGYSEGRTTKIITASKDRLEPRCSHYKACSSYQYINYPKQIEIKEGQIKEVLSRQLKIETPEITFKQSPHIWGYRNKIKLKIITHDNKQRLAYTASNTADTFIPIDDCSLSPLLTNSFLHQFSETLSSTNLSGLNQITVKQNSKDELLLSISHDTALEAEDIALSLKPLLAQFPVQGAVLINEDDYTKTTICKNDYFTETIKDVEFYIGANSFFQINTEMLKLLIEDLQNNLTLNTNTILADLYCGVGTFAILLASKVKKVIGIEYDPENFFFLEKNIESNNIKNFNVRMCDCKDVMPSLIQQKVDTVIVDPPRKGLDAKMCKALAASTISDIVYISCNPATLARDLNFLLNSYEIKNIYAYDFFPNTPHIETMVVLTKK
jgi:23S rRNA (uracil1939-C5)-methyltransferase